MRTKESKALKNIQSKDLNKTEKPNKVQGVVNLSGNFANCWLVNFSPKFCMLFDGFGLVVFKLNFWSKIYNCDNWQSKNESLRVYIIKYNTGVDVCPVDWRHCVFLPSITCTCFNIITTPLKCQQVIFMVSVFSVECTIGMVWRMTSLKHYCDKALWHYDAMALWP